MAPSRVVIMTNMEPERWVVSAALLRTNVVSLTFASWNQIMIWLRQLEGLKRWLEFGGFLRRGSAIA